MGGLSLLQRYNIHTCQRNAIKIRSIIRIYIRGRLIPFKSLTLLLNWFVE